MRKDNFIYLLLALIIFLVLLPILSDLQLVSDGLIRLISFTCLLAIGVWSLRDSIPAFRFGVALMTIGIISNVLAITNGASVFHYLSQLSMFAFLLLAIVRASRQVVWGVEMTANRLFGAICVYLMLGILWAIMYGALGSLVAGSFAGATHVVSNDWNVEWIYYSFVTLTTLGYGDILPVSATARVLAYSEAVFGVFYMAMLVSVLVSAYSAENQKRN
jgi:voltage-gated potassium channel